MLFIGGSSKNLGVWCSHGTYSTSVWWPPAQQKLLEASGYCVIFIPHDDSVWCLLCIKFQTLFSSSMLALTTVLTWSIVHIHTRTYPSTHIYTNARHGYSHIHAYQHTIICMLYNTYCPQYTQAHNFYTRIHTYYISYKHMHNTYAYIYITNIYTQVLSI